VMAPSFVRVVMTTLFTLTAFGPLVWFAALSADERLFLRQKAAMFLHLRNAKIGRG